MRHPDRVERLVVLDTIVYPDMALAMRALLAAMRLPGVGDWFTSPAGLTLTMRLGMVNRQAMTGDALAGYLAPFTTRQDRRTLCKELTALRVDEFVEIVRNLHVLRTVPTLIAWAEKDYFLPASEMRRLQRDLPDARTVTLPHREHDHHPLDNVRIALEALDEGQPLLPGLDRPLALKLGSEGATLLSIFQPYGDLRGPTWQVQ